MLCPSSSLPSLQNNLPQFPTKSWLDDGVPVLRPDCPIFQSQGLPQLLTRLKDGTDPISDHAWIYFSSNENQFHLLYIIIVHKLKYAQKIYIY